MKILIVNDCGLRGSGAEIRIRLLVEELLKRQTYSEIHVLEHETSSTKFQGVTIHRCSTQNSGFVTAHIIKKNSIDLVQVHNLASISTRPIIAAKKLKKPVLFFLHDYWPLCGRRYLYSKWNTSCSETQAFKCMRCIGIPSYIHVLRTRKDLNKCDVGIAPSTFCKELYEHHGLLRGKWQVVTPWIDKIFNLPLKKEVNREQNRILFVGPLSKAKGAYLLAEAFAEVKKVFPETKLYYVGYGQEKTNQERTQLEQLFQDTGILHAVSFLGEKTSEQLKEEYARAGVYVCCPLWPEVFGQTWAQALACGAPVVATNVGSIPELSSSVVIVNSTPISLAQGIIQVLKEQKREKRQSWLEVQNVIGTLEKIYQEFISF